MFSGRLSRTFLNLGAGGNVLVTPRRMGDGLFLRAALHQFRPGFGARPFRFIPVLRLDAQRNISNGGVEKSDSAQSEAERLGLDHRSREFGCAVGPGETQ
eukprot:9497128-Pyramimonas_sp.AAC.1